jgi:hypothetical protein
VELSYGTCQAILKKDLALYPYRLTCVQEPHPDDFPLRAEYCHWFLNTFDGGLLEKTFFSYEAWFHLSEFVNSQNMRIWSTENPHVYVKASLHPQKFGVWAAMDLYIYKRWKIFAANLRIVKQQLTAKPYSHCFVLVYSSKLF